MKNSVLQCFALAVIAFVGVACTNIEESSSVNEAQVIADTTYDCTYFSYYNSLSDCQNATNATCTNEVESFPNGATATCYIPPAGYNSCQVSPPTWNWIYTNPGWCDTGTTDGTNEIYQQNRSLVTCSSSICTCSEPVQLVIYCAGVTAYTDQDIGAPTGTIGCGNYSPNPASTPIPGASVTPTPIPMCGATIGATPTPAPAVQVNLSNYYNFIGIFNDNSTYQSTDGFDHVGDGFTAAQLTTSVTYNGQTLLFGPVGANDMISSTNGISIPLTGNYSQILLIASSLGTQTNQTFTVTYTDSTTTAFTQTFSDWGTPVGNNPGETTVAETEYEDSYTGVQSTTIDNYIYGYTFTINNTKVLQSISTPANANVQIIGMMLVP